MNWYDDHQSLYELADWLLANDPQFTVLDIMDLLKEPWCWDREWKQYKAETSIVFGAIR